MAAQGVHGIELSGIGFNIERKVCLLSAIFDLLGNFIPAKISG